MSGQVAIREDATTVRMAKAPSLVSLAIRNSSSSSLQAVVSLQWIAPQGKPDATVRRTVELNPGESSVEFSLPLPTGGDPLLERLHYEVIPGERNYTAFVPQQGMLSLPEIAESAFTLTVVTADLPRRGISYPIYALAANPITRKPVSGVEIRCGEVSALTGVDGTARLQIPIEDSESSDAITVEAKLGDYLEPREVPLFVMPDGVRIYTDKPLYQPGQTMHVRILALSSAGPVQANAEHEIRVIDENQELLFDAKATTSRFGIASADWSIPQNARPGRYTIQVLREAVDSNWSREVEIRRYELPSFRVSAKPERTFYLSGQKAVVHVAADYLFGKPVEKGMVRVAAENSDKTIAAGELKSGHFRATLDPEQIPDHA